MIYFIYYIIGSIPSAYIISLINKSDVTRQGSGNLGATNISRVIGKKWGKLCFLIDFFKAFIPLYILKYNNVFLVEISIYAIAILLGHSYSIFTKLKGGKGISCIFGILLVIDINIFLLFSLSWVIIFKLSKTVSLASIVSSLLLPIIVYFLHNIELFYIHLCLSLFIIYKHRSNIKKLINKSEYKFIKK